MERSLRVLDGAVLVLCAVAGVQSQSITVDRQMKRYAVPRIAFINKMDRTGANPANVIQQLESKLGLTTIPLQFPIGAESSFQGVIDLIDRVAIYFDGEKGEDVRPKPIPADMIDATERARQGMLEALSMISDQIMELLLEEAEVPIDLIHKTIREGTIAQQLCPVMVGSAYRNKGVQSLLDAICRYLPSPLDREIFAKDHANRGAEVPLAPDPDAPLVAMAFKLVEEPFGQVTFVRIYQGTLSKGSFYFNTRQRKRTRISRILRIHADQKEDIDSASAGDIVAVMGIECATGDTYCSEGTDLSLESIFAAEPVIDLSIQPVKRADYDKLAKALQPLHARGSDVPGARRSRNERDDHFRDGRAPPRDLRRADSPRIQGRLHRRRPKVSYREAPTKETPFNYKHRKQTGGSGQYAHVVGKLIPLDPQSPEPFIFENKVTGGRIPSEYIPSVEKGFRESLHKGPVAGYEVIGVHMRLEDGSYHDVDSSTMAFEICARDCFRETFKKADPVLLEPIMKVEVEIPTEFQGPVTGAISSKRGVILGTESRSGYTVITAEVPLAEMFGYSNDLRSMTQGKGSFSMEFLKYQKLPSRFQEEIVKKATLAKATAKA